MHGRFRILAQLLSPEVLETQQHDHSNGGDDDDDDDDGLSSLLLTLELRCKMLDDDDADDVYCFVGAYGERVCEGMGLVFMC